MIMERLEQYSKEDSMDALCRSSTDLYLDEFQFGGLEIIKHQRNSAAAMTQFPISITLKLFFSNPPN